MLPFSPDVLPTALRDPRVLAAMERVPRARFVPGELRSRAEEDVALPIGHGQTISQPAVVAYMSAGLACRPGDRVLEVGTGSGYQTAVLAALGATVYTIEIVAALSRTAAGRLKELELDSQVHFRVGDGWHGWPEHAPYDGIICTAAPGRRPPELETQVVDGGRLVIPIGPRSSQSLQVLERRGERFELIAHWPVRFVPLVHGE